MKPSKKVVAGTAAAFTVAVLGATTPFLKKWEGTDLVAVRDPIGTGHPLTYCNGLTATDGSVKPGQKFTPAQCDARLAKALPKYLNPLQACIKKTIPVHSMAAALDAAYNAGPVAVCRSPMVTRFNEGAIEAGCNAFKGWYISSAGVVRRGLINRRNAEVKLCLQGLAEPQPTQPMPWWQRWARLVTFKS